MAINAFVKCINGNYLFGFGIMLLMNLYSSLLQ